MPYTVPQFIEREPKIVGPFTFKQFVFIGAAAGLSVFFYFALPFYLFLVAAVVLGGGALAMVFLKVAGFPLPVVIKNFFIFLTRSRIYLWKKKALPPKIVKKREPVKEAGKEESVLKPTDRGKLGGLATFLETKTK